MSNRASKKTPGSESWCPRCQEREGSPDPKIPLLNQRHEQFCRNLAVGKMGRGDAYMAAGFTTQNKATATEQARRLTLKLEIANRISALLEQTIELDIKNREWVDAELTKLYEAAMAKGDLPTAKGVLHLKGKDRGMFVEKVEINQADAETQGKSDAEVRAMLMAHLYDLGRPFFIQAAEEIFGLKLTDGGQEADGGKTPMVGSVRTLQ